MSEYPTKSTAKPYFGTDGEPRTLWQMVRDEPEWAVSRIKAGEEAIAQRDEYHEHLALIAEMTGNSGDIGAAHEGVNAVIEECAARLKRIEFLNQQNTAQQEQIDALAAHMEKLSSNALALADACENKTDLPLHKWAVKCAMLVSRVQEEVKELPSTSLARHDAQIKANELKRFIGIYLTPGLAHNRAIGELQSLQKQAEGHQ